MIIIDNLEQVANQIETERGVAKELLFKAVEQALSSACRKKLGDGSQLECELNGVDGSVSFYRVKEIVEDVFSESTEITLKEAKKIDNTVELDGEVKVPFIPPDFGRIAAQVAKQVIIQRLREAEKDSVFEEFQDKVGTIVTGTVQRVENRNYLINLGRTEAILRFSDQILGERFEVNESIRVYVVNVDRANRPNMVSISRTHTGLLKKLFEIEIPEINDGIIDVMSVSREPGIRAKVGVRTNNPSIGAVGTCVGQMGGRIQAIIKELGNEKIDVLEWDEDIKTFIANALKPAKVTSVFITDIDQKTATVVVPNDQLSLAIGKRGINVRLSSHLTGWNLNVISEDELSQSKGSIVDKIKQFTDSDDSQTDDSSLSLESSFLAKAISRDAKIEKDMSDTQEKLKQKVKSISNNNDDSDMKVSDLAKLLNVKTQELIDRASKKGITIKSNRVKLSPEQVKEIKEKVFI
ncbi:transcription termination/antitermination protein NusA [Candidatus Marinamargulisbacteria bacterium SCGC AG-343-D04]|nr:transcription termination/antitermination protein NusA [Candidatus Marinamargulisbacteria bacterium SCGC AG-343-D04]